jgi:hypothetical protein
MVKVMVKKVLETNVGDSISSIVGELSHLDVG